MTHSKYTDKNRGSCYCTNKCSNEQEGTLTMNVYKKHEPPITEEGIINFNNIVLIIRKKTPSESTKTKCNNYYND